MVAAKSSKNKSKARIFGNEMKLPRGANKSDPISIIERYRKECGSLKIGEIEGLDVHFTDMCYYGKAK